MTLTSLAARAARMPEKTAPSGAVFHGARRSQAVAPMAKVSMASMLYITSRLR
jgi:hypothetical protein